MGITFVYYSTVHVCFFCYWSFQKLIDVQSEWYMPVAMWCMMHCHWSTVLYAVLSKWFFQFVVWSCQRRRVGASFMCKGGGLEHWSPSSLELCSQCVILSCFPAFWGLSHSSFWWTAEKRGMDLVSSMAHLDWAYIFLFCIPSLFAIEFKTSLKRSYLTCFCHFFR